MSLGISPLALDRFFDTRIKSNAEEGETSTGNITNYSPGVIVRGDVLSLVGPFVSDDDPCAGWFGDAYVDARSVRDALDNMEGDIFLDLDSPGGVLDTGTAIGGAVDDYRKAGNRVTARVRSLAASAATVPMVRSDEILIDEIGAVMIHAPMVLAIGNATDLREMADRLERYETAMASMYEQRRSMTADAVREAMQDETFFVGEQAVGVGLVDGVLAVPETAEAANETDSDETAEADSMALMMANLPVRQVGKLAARLGV